MKESVSTWLISPTVDVTFNKSNPPTLSDLEAVIEKFKVDEKYAEKFGRLVIQDDGGRMKPVNTFSSELLRKVSKSDTYKNMNCDQVFLSMTQFQLIWYQIPIINIKKGNDSIRTIQFLSIFAIGAITSLIIREVAEKIKAGK